MYSLENKINQLFIVGFDGFDAKKAEYFNCLLEHGLGGVIFFTKNILSSSQFAENSAYIKEKSLIPPFLSIDQEGGRVERTENIHGGKKYLSAKFAAQNGVDFVEKQTEALCDELLSFGINMNFAPVLDTNTNPKNPIIGERAYGDNPDDVIKFAQKVIEIHKKKGIIPVGKHFPGHGDTSVDSHIDMPKVDLSKEEMEKSHLKPFVYAINHGLDAVMAAHVYYTCYDDQPLPASLSANVLTKLLRQKLNFEGLILSDDMVMGAVCDKNPSVIYSQALKAGINVFLYRNSDEKLLNIIENIQKSAETDTIFLSCIDKSFEKVLKLKRKYGLLQ